MQSHEKLALCICRRTLACARIEIRICLYTQHKSVGRFACPHPTTQQVIFTCQPLLQASPSRLTRSQIFAAQKLCTIKMMMRSTALLSNITPQEKALASTVYQERLSCVDEERTNQTRPEKPNASNVSECTKAMHKNFVFVNPLRSACTHPAVQNSVWSNRGLTLGTSLHHVSRKNTCNQKRLGR